MIDFSQIGRRGRPIIIAHRGAGHRQTKTTSKSLRKIKNVVYENSLEGFEKAIEIGAEAIEFDLRCTKDGVIVVHHNIHLKRSSVPIRELTFDRLQRLAEKRGYHIPTLEETLKKLSGRIALDIEIKRSGFEKEAVDIVRKYYDNNSIVFTSFIDKVVGKLKEIAPEIKSGLLLGLRPPAAIMAKSLDPAQIVKRIKNCRADFLAPHWRLLRMPYFANNKNSGLPVAVWTVNRMAVAKKLIGSNCAAIISDYPEKILELVR